MKKIIKENWQFIEQVEDKVKEQTGDPQAGFNAGIFFFGSKDRQMMINAKYRKTLKRKTGDIFSENYSEIGVYIEYCPFSGKPLYEQVEYTKTIN